MQKLKATKSNSIDLNGYKNRRDIIDKVVSQINKDLNLDIYMNADGDSTELYESLLQEVSNELRKMLTKSGGQIEQALYKIDVSEKAVSRALSDFKEEEPVVIFARLILERELQKVVFRLVYSKSINQ